MRTKPNKEKRELQEKAAEQNTTVKAIKKQRKKERIANKPKIHKK